MHFGFGNKSLWSLFWLKVCGASEGQELPPNFVKLPKEFYTPDAIAASDVMLGKFCFP